MSNVKLISCIVREADPGFIACEVTYEMTFTNTEVKLDLGFVATLFVTPSLFLTKETRSDGVSLSDGTTYYRLEVPATLGVVYPGGQAKVVKTSAIKVDKNSLFTDLSPAKLSEEEKKATLWKRPVWTKAIAWDPLYAGIDVRLELTLDFCAAPKVESADLRFANRAGTLSLSPLTATTRSTTAGGTAGTPFEDAIPPNTVQISRLFVYGSNRPTGIKVEWQDGSGQRIMGPPHGVTNTISYEYALEPGEYITEVSGYHLGAAPKLLPGTPTTSLKAVDAVEFLTNFKRKLGPVGSAVAGSQQYFITGLKVVGFTGRSSTVSLSGLGNIDLLDQLGFISRVDAVASPSPVDLPVIDTTDDLKGTITARGENGSAEGKEKLFDNQSGTKWLDFSPGGSWVQYTYAAGIAGRLSSYTLTSAGDAPERDPTDWQLLGSSDGGATWAMVDSRVGIAFSQRNQKLPFTVSGTPTYKAYRLNITKILNSATASSVQLAELELLGQQVTGQ